MDDRTRKQDGLFEASFDGVERKGFRVAVIGGGPGGMFTAWHLAAKAGPSCRITVFEASDRLGGKILTGEFAGVGPYEAGVAEIYDYSRLGPDPLHDLIVKDLGLQPKYLHGGPCVLDGKIILDPDGLAETFGERTRDEVTSFRQRVADLLSPEAFYFSIPKQDNAHPWAAVSGAALLERDQGRDRATLHPRDGAQRRVGAAAPDQWPHLPQERADGRRGLPVDLFGRRRQRADRRAPGRRDRRRRGVRRHRAFGRAAARRNLSPGGDEGRRHRGGGGGLRRARLAADRALDHRLALGRAAPRHEQAHRLFRPARPLSARDAPVRASVLARARVGQLVHGRRLRRLLRL